MADTNQVIDILGIITNGLKTGKTLYNDTTCMWLEEAIEHLKEYQKIVKCKDCKWFIKKFENEGRCIKHDNDYHDPDWFCADGEKKE